MRHDRHLVFLLLIISCKACQLVTALEHGRLAASQGGLRTVLEAPVVRFPASQPAKPLAGRVLLQQPSTEWTRQFAVANSSWVNLLNAALLSKGKQALVWNQELVDELVWDIQNDKERDRVCGGDLNVTFQGDDVVWTGREYDKPPSVAVAATLAGSYWMAVKSNPEDVVGYSPFILSTLRGIYTGAYTQSSVGCVLEVCRQSGVPANQTVVTCLFAPGEPQPPSRIEQSSGCKRVVVRTLDYRLSLPAVAQQHNVTLANLVCWNRLSSVTSAPAYVIIPCYEDVAGAPVCAAMQQYEAVKDMIGFTATNTAWVAPVNQFLATQRLNKVMSDPVLVQVLQQSLNSASIARGRCGAEVDIPGFWTLAWPSPGSPLNVRITAMLLSMLYVAEHVQLDDVSTLGGWSTTDVVRMLYMFQGKLPEGTARLGCALQVCNATWSRPICIMRAVPTTQWNGVSTASLLRLADMPRYLNTLHVGAACTFINHLVPPAETCVPAASIMHTGSGSTFLKLSRDTGRDLQQLVCWQPYVQNMNYVPPYIGLPCPEWVDKQPCDALKAFLGNDVYKYVVSPFQNMSSVVEVLNLTSYSNAACKLCCFNRIQPSDQQLHCEPAPLMTLTISRQALVRPIDGCPCLVGTPEEAQTVLDRRRGSSPGNGGAGSGSPTSSSSSAVNIGLLVGVCMGAVLLVLLAALIGLAVLFRRQQLLLKQHLDQREFLIRCGRLDATSSQGGQHGSATYSISTKTTPVHSDMGIKRGTFAGSSPADSGHLTQEVPPMLQLVRKGSTSIPEAASEGSTSYTSVGGEQTLSKATQDLQQRWGVDALGPLPNPPRPEVVFAVHSGSLRTRATPQSPRWANAAATVPPHAQRGVHVEGGEGYGAELEDMSGSPSTSVATVPDVSA